MASIVSALSKTITVDYVGTRSEGNKTIYTLKATSPLKTLVEAKSKIISILNFPPDIPENITIEQVKKGLILKDYRVEVTVPKNRFGKPRDLVAKKYGVLRRRPYSGE